MTPTMHWFVSTACHATALGAFTVWFFSAPHDTATYSLTIAFFFLLETIYFRIPKEGK